MNLTSILVNAAGSTEVNGKYNITSPADTESTLYQRIWLNEAQTCQIYFRKKTSTDDTTAECWCIASYSKTTTEITTYYEFYKPGTLDGSIVNPWDPTGQWYANSGVVPAPYISSTYDNNILITTDDPVITTDDDGHTVTTTVTHYLNVITGSETIDRQIVTEKESIKQTTLTRQDMLNLNIGTTYRFRFIDKFASLGYSGDNITSGSYTVDAIMSYTQIVGGGIDIYKNLYAPLNISKDVYNYDLENTLGNSIFYKLTDPNDSDVHYYIPASFISGVPDSSINCYQKLILTIDLGIYSDATDVEDILEDVSSVLAAKYGIRREDAYVDEDTGETVQAFVPCQVLCYEKEYLNINEYELIQYARTSRIGKYVEYSLPFVYDYREFYIGKNINLKTKYEETTYPFKPGSSEEEAEKIKDHYVGKTIRVMEKDTTPFTAANKAYYVGKTIRIPAIYTTPFTTDNKYYYLGKTIYIKVANDTYRYVLMTNEVIDYYLELYKETSIATLNGYEYVTLTNENIDSYIEAGITAPIYYAADILLTTANIDTYLNRRVSTTESDLAYNFHIYNPVFSDLQYVNLTNENIDVYLGFGTIVDPVNVESFVEPTIDSSTAKAEYETMLNRLFNTENNENKVAVRRLQAQVAAYEEILNSISSK